MLYNATQSYHKLLFYQRILAFFLGLIKVALESLQIL